MIYKIKKILILIILIIFSLKFLNSNPNDFIYNEFKKAENFYQKGEYEKALKIYKSLENKIKNFNLYYNTGNTYFKLKNYAMAKVYYLRAYKIKQNDNDLNHNLKVLELYLKDKIKLPEPDPFTKLLNKFKMSLNINGFFMITLLLILLLSLIFTFYNGKYKKTILYVLILFLFLSFIMDIIKVNDYKETRYVLIKNSVEVRSEPSEKSNSVFIIHSGTDFKIREKLEGWYLIVLKNGFRGWINIKENRDFVKI